jgi:hypothetical protein
MEEFEARIVEIEQRQARFRLASDGTDGWVNWIEGRLNQERDFTNSLLVEIITDLHRKFADIVAQAHADHVRGTFQPSTSYKAFDVVACNGGSFIARKDDPGPCPGGGWQLIARQGQRGIAGEKGERGKDAMHIVKWQVDTTRYIATPIMDGGGRGPELELRPLFAAFLAETSKI